jgi:hypothetical protein
MTIPPMTTAPLNTVKGIARPSRLKPGDDGVLSDPGGVPFTQDNRQEHGSENMPVGLDTTPRRGSGASVDIDSAEMPDDGVIEVHDDDDDILDASREGSDPAP